MRCVTCLTVFLACTTQFHGTLQPVGALHAVLDPVQHQQHRDLRAFRRSLIGSKRPWIEPVSWRPRAFVYHNFLTTEEADHIIAQAKPWMKRSTVVGINGDSVQDEVRTSYGTFLARLHDPVLARVQQRVSEWTHLNISHQEDMQVLRYGHGQQYGAHYDSLVTDSPRVATVLLYLSDVEEGGETAFPSSEWLHESLSDRMGPFSKCAQGHVAVPARKGDALLFFSLKPDGMQDGTSLHTGCPVLKGVKWTGTVWIHTKPFRLETLGKDLTTTQQLPEECEDVDEKCRYWASTGECKANPSFMIGDAHNLGSCRLSCGECERCVPGDRTCRSNNRVRAGYLSLEELEAS